MAALDAGKLGRAPGAETGSRGGGRRLVCESQQRAQASGELAHDTTRRVVAVARRVSILGVRAGRWCRVERPRRFGRSQGWGSSEGTARGRAGGEMATP